MSFTLADRVQETTATTGTGTLSLLGATAQMQGFVAGIGNGNACNYCLLSGNGTDWETGYGTVTSGTPNTLSRDTVLASSNSGSKISLTGTSTVFCTAPASFLVNIWVACQIFTSSGTYTPSAGVTAADVTIVGGGGGSGSAAATGAGQVAIGGGGAAGGACRKRIVNPTAQTVTIGAGGAAGTAGGAGGTGGNSTFGAILTASGGLGGAGGPATAPPVGVVGGSGGGASGGDINITGQSGGGQLVAAGSALALSATGGSPGFGLGVGAPPLLSGAANGGLPATGYGAGAGGAANIASQLASNGAAGQPGICIIDEYR